VSSGRILKTVGALLFLVGLLTSPVKRFALRCWSNPAGWLETQCEQFRQFHSPWGYAFLFAGMVMIVVGVLDRRRKKNHDV
jgi:hypothetical protein